jgi:hypothetical protein
VEEAVGALEAAADSVVASEVVEATSAEVAVTGAAAADNS